MHLRKSDMLIMILLLIAALVVLLLPTNASAQDVTDEPTLVATDPAPEPTLVVTLEPTETPPPVDPPEELPPTPPADVLSRLLALLDNATYIIWAAAGVVIITGALKTLAFLVGWRIEGIQAALLALVVQVIIWILYSVANALGAGEVFRSQYEIVVEVIRSLLPLVGSIFGGHVLYQAAAKRRVPVLGFYPPPELKEYKTSEVVGVVGEGKDWRNQP